MRYILIDELYPEAFDNVKNEIVDNKTEEIKDKERFSYWCFTIFKSSEDLERTYDFLNKFELLTSRTLNFSDMENTNFKKNNFTEQERIFKTFQPNKFYSFYEKRNSYLKLRDSQYKRKNLLKIVEDLNFQDQFMKEGINNNFENYILKIDWKNIIEYQINNSLKTKTENLINVFCRFFSFLAINENINLNEIIHIFFDKFDILAKKSSKPHHNNFIFQNHLDLEIKTWFFSNTKIINKIEFDILNSTLETVIDLSKKKINEFKTKDYLNHYIDQEEIIYTSHLDNSSNFSINIPHFFLNIYKKTYIDTYKNEKISEFLKNNFKYQKKTLKEITFFNHNFLKFEKNKLISNRLNKIYIYL